ncbi:efflux RND transporter periplasmic adaptor subunit [Telmatobacter sp. DSM 110680]|uniref:Efflux RND transporter periplasmic adaptor subunit n=1 Tax=Telmatobacter sp. DSM 110680 TaxID=3036704 RepID=A0AAU7DFH4_9BACT
MHAAQVSQEPLASTISTNGIVEPIHPIEVHAPIPALVKAVYVQAGDTVSVGKLLLQLDDIDARAKLASADSAVKAAQASLEATTQNGTLEQRQAATADVARNKLERDQAQRDVDALVKLSATGAAAPSEVAAARQRLATAEANLHAAETAVQSRYSPAEVARAQAAVRDAEAGRQAAQQVLAESSVHAPAAGTIYSLNVNATEFVEQGKLLLQMADLHQERVRAYFDEPEIGKLAVGQAILIKWDAKPGQVWHGKIERVPITIINSGTRNVGEVLIHIDDMDGQLLPETHVTVTATTSSQENALSIPREALRSENGKTYVFKINGDELKKTYVVTGALNLTQVAILSGLQVGDWVATGTTTGQPLQEDVPIKRVR